MIIHELKMHNFKAFRSTHTVDFSGYAPGLHFISGENKDEPRMGANGAGKSSLFDAIHWCLYGKTVHGRAAATVVTHGRKECGGGIKFSNNSQEYEVVRRRARDGATIMLNGDECGQDAVDNVVGLPSDLFALCVVRGQFAPMFFDMSPADQLKIMSDVLNLDEWAACSSKASAIYKKDAEALAECEEDAAREDGALRAMREMREEEGKLRDGWASEKKARVEMKVALFGGIKADEAKWKDKVDALERTMRDCEGRLRSLGNLDDSEDKELRARKAMDKAAREMDYALGKEELARDAVNALLDTASHKECPTCMQDISPSHMSSCVAEARAVLNDRSDAASAVCDVHARKKKAWERAARAFETHRAEVNSAQADVRQFEREWKHAQRVYENARKDHARYNDELAKMKAEENPHARTIAKLDDKIKKGDADARAREAKIKDMRKALAATKYWVSGFKELRLFAIDRAVAALEVEVNSNLMALGMDRHQVEFSCMRQTKSGGVVRKFDILIRRDGDSEPIPMREWSGGEQQRFRLACQMGLADLIANVRAVKFGFEIWDEPTAHLSQEGVSDLLEVLYQRARDVQRRIFLVDHVAIDYQFDSVTDIVKEEDTARVVS